MKLRDVTNANWVKRSPIAIRNPKGAGRMWELECLHCGKHANLTTTQANNNSPKCVCQTQLHCDVRLSHLGQSKSIAEWRRIYPAIKDTSIRNRISKRLHKEGNYGNYTDSQVLFGKKGLPDNMTPADIIEQTQIGVQNDLQDLILNVMKGMEDAIVDVVNTRIYPFMVDQRTINKCSSAEILAGGEYEVLRINTIQESLDAGVPAQEIIETLESEKWATPEEKAQALIAFIPVDMSTNVLTGLEIMALFSTVSQFDLN